MCRSPCRPRRLLTPLSIPTYAYLRLGTRRGTSHARVLRASASVTRASRVECLLEHSLCPTPPLSGGSSLTGLIDQRLWYLRELPIKTPRGPHRRSRQSFAERFARITKSPSLAPVYRPQRRPTSTLASLHVTIRQHIHATRLWLPQPFSTVSLTAESSRRAAQSIFNSRLKKPTAAFRQRSTLLERTSRSTQSRITN
jgi:hypothetical protein